MGQLCSCCDDKEKDGGSKSNRAYQANGADSPARNVRESTSRVSTPVGPSPNGTALVGRGADDGGGAPASSSNVPPTTVVELSSSGGAVAAGNAVDLGARDLHSPVVRAGAPNSPLHSSSRTPGTGNPAVGTSLAEVMGDKGTLPSLQKTPNSSATASPRLPPKLQFTVREVKALPKEMNRTQNWIRKHEQRAVRRSIEASMGSNSNSQLAVDERLLTATGAAVSGGSGSRDSASSSGGDTSSSIAGEHVLYEIQWMESENAAAARSSVGDGMIGAAAPNYY